MMEYEIIVIFQYVHIEKKGKDMRSFIIILGLFCLYVAYSGSPKDSEKNIESIKMEIEESCVEFKAKLDDEEYISDYDKKITAMFKLDTFRIERLLSARINLYPSTHDVTQAIYYAEMQYDTLMNKYYKILLDKLSQEDREYLRKAQRSWLEYRDNEKELAYQLSKDEYSGGGSIQQIIVSSDDMEITKRRVLDLYYYMTRFYE